LEGNRDAASGASLREWGSADKPMTELKTTVTRDDGTIALVGEALYYTIPLVRPATTGNP